MEFLSGTAGNIIQGCRFLMFSALSQGTKRNMSLGICYFLHESLPKSLVYFNCRSDRQQHFIVSTMQFVIPLHSVQHFIINCLCNFSFLWTLKAFYLFTQFQHILFHLSSFYSLNKFYLIVSSSLFYQTVNSLKLGTMFYFYTSCT